MEPRTLNASATWHRHRQLHDRQRLRPPARPRLAPLHANDIPYFDLHVTQRDVSIARLPGRGARDVIKIQTAYEPTLHFPPPPGWTDADRDRGVSFIGTPYDDRAAFLTRLWKEAASPSPSPAPRSGTAHSPPEAAAALYKEGELYSSSTAKPSGDRRSTSASSPTPTRTSSSTRASRSPAAGASCSPSAPPATWHRFVEDKEAVFFSSFEECLAKIRRYLPDEAARNRIAAAGHARAISAGYSNDHQVSLILDRIRTILAARAVPSQ